jgi:alkylation response protein AidB-like acyl-CoA dehydrogenase
VNLHFTEEQIMMRKMVREFAKSEVEPFVEEMEKGVFPRVILQKMGELGLMGIPIPKEYEGALPESRCTSPSINSQAQYGRRSLLSGLA